MMPVKVEKASFTQCDSPLMPILGGLNMGRLRRDDANYYDYLEYNLHKSQIKSIMGSSCLSVCQFTILTLD